MFCGRCGRAVNAAPLSRARVADPRPGDTTILGPSTQTTSSRQITDDAPAGPDADAGPRRESPADPESLIETRPIAVATAGGPGRPEASQEAPPGSQEPPVPYVLSFSTGERIVVVGSGLLGRRPYVQPEESFEQLVSIADHERSVSKTHLEFGLEGGDLWIRDRYSANGTVIIPPSGAPHHLEPGRRYRVPRAGRVEIGDRWFDVR
jgi:hypothetical protein